MSTHTQTHEHPRPIEHGIARLLVETTDGRVFDVIPRPEDKATLELETKRDVVPGAHAVYPPVCYASERTVFDVTARIRMDSLKRPHDKPPTFSVVDQASAVVMRQTGPMEFALDTPVTQRTDVAPQVDPDAIQIGVPDRQQPALAFVQRNRSTGEPGAWFLGDGAVPEEPLERAMLRALLTTALADLDEAENPALTVAGPIRARDIIGGSL